MRAAQGGSTVEEADTSGAAKKKRKYGFNMSLLGMVANGLGGIIVFVVVIILTQALSGPAAQSS